MTTFVSLMMLSFAQIAFANVLEVAPVTWNCPTVVKGKSISRSTCIAEGKKVLSKFECDSQGTARYQCNLVSEKLGERWYCFAEKAGQCAQPVTLKTVGQEPRTACVQPSKSLAERFQLKTVSDTALAKFNLKHVCRLEKVKTVPASKEADASSVKSARE